MLNYALNNTCASGRWPGEVVLGCGRHPSLRIYWVLFKVITHCLPQKLMHLWGWSFSFRPGRGTTPCTCLQVNFYLHPPMTLRPRLVPDVAEFRGLESPTQPLLISTHSLSVWEVFHIRDISVSDGGQVKVRIPFSMSQRVVKFSTPCGWSHSPPKAAKTITQLNQQQQLTAETGVKGEGVKDHFWILLQLEDEF